MEEKTNETEELAWQTFRGVIDGFLGNKMGRNYKELVKNLSRVQNMDCHMFVKLHFLCFHLDSFRSRLDGLNEEHGEKFHQDFEPMER